MGKIRKENVSPERLRSLLEYNPETGSLVWKVDLRRGTIKAGTQTGNAVNIDRVAYSANRVIWCMSHGEWLWLNGNPKDRRLCNIGIVPPPPADGVLTVEYLKKVLHYEPQTGNFFHKVTQHNAHFGQLAGHVTAEGYVTISVLGKFYRAHRLAWFMEKGAWPDGDLDHKNLDKSDNRISNLRPATRSQNVTNTRPDRYRSNTGVRGIHRRRGQYDVTCNGKWIGGFKSLEHAVAARLSAERIHQGEFAYSRRAL